MDSISQQFNLVERGFAMSISFAKTVVPTYAKPENVIPRKSRQAKGAKSAPAAKRAASIDPGELLSGGVFSPDDKPAKQHGEREKSAQELLLDHAIDASARFLVTHNGRLLATFVSEDDALLFEGELADIDRARGTQSALCEVRDRKGHRLGGYVITAGHCCVYVRDEQFKQRFGGAGKRIA